jgi:hypothetical protein
MIGGGGSKAGAIATNQAATTGLRRTAGIVIGIARVIGTHAAAS